MELVRQRKSEGPVPEIELTNFGQGFECEFCGVKILWKPNLKRHLNNKHAKEFKRADKGEAENIEEEQQPATRKQRRRHTLPASGYLEKEENDIEEEDDRSNTQVTKISPSTKNQSALSQSFLVGKKVVSETDDESLQFDENLETNEPNIDEESGRIFCEHCGDDRTFASSVSLRWHKRQKHPELHKEECPYCHERFINDFAVKIHISRSMACKMASQNLPMETATDENNGDSDYVEEAVEVREDEEEEVSDDGRVKCQFCELRYLRNNVGQHIQTQHYDEMPFECSSCQRRFLNLFGFQVHQGRTKACYSATLVTVQSATSGDASDDDKITCNFCDTRLVKKSMSNHLQQFHKDKLAFGCSNCGKRFLNQTGFTIHLGHVKECSEANATTVMFPVTSADGSGDNKSPLKAVNFKKRGVSKRPLQIVKPKILSSALVMGGVRYIFSSSLFFIIFFFLTFSFAGSTPKIHGEPITIHWFVCIVQAVVNPLMLSLNIAESIMDGEVWKCWTRMLF